MEGRLVGRKVGRKVGHVGGPDGGPLDGLEGGPLGGPEGPAVAKEVSLLYERLVLLESVQVVQLVVKEEME